MDDKYLQDRIDENTGEAFLSGLEIMDSKIYDLEAKNKLLTEALDRITKLSNWDGHLASKIATEALNKTK